MELYHALLKEILSQGTIKVEFPEIDPDKVVELRCYQALYEIRAILSDSSLDDPECFYRIEEIVRVFERIGISGGGRHDFG